MRPTDPTFEMMMGRRVVAPTITVPTPPVFTTGNSFSYGTAAFTPAANSLLVFIGFLTNNSLDGTASGGGIGWTRRANILFNGGDALFAFTAQVGASPSSMSPFMFGGTNPGSGAAIFMFQVTGHRVASPVAQAVSGIATSTNPTLTRAAPGLKNGYIAAWGGQLAAGASTPPSGWAENGDGGYITPTANASSAYLAGGESSLSVAFGAASTNWGAVYLEINHK